MNKKDDGIIKASSHRLAAPLTFLARDLRAQAKTVKAAATECHRIATFITLLCPTLTITWYVTIRTITILTITMIPIMIMILILIVIILILTMTVIILILTIPTTSSVQTKATLFNLPRWSRRRSHFEEPLPASLRLESFWVKDD